MKKSLAAIGFVKTGGEKAEIGEDALLKQTSGEEGKVSIGRFEAMYRDDLIFMILQAKDALGRKPGLNEDLLDIKKNYIDSGGDFWVAINEKDRVIGSIGYLHIAGTKEAVLHRLFVKATEKNKGIGTKLLLTAESEMRERGVKVSEVHLGTPEEQWFESYAFYRKHGYVEYKECYMRKEL